MQPRITLITLGVADLERAVRFYRDGLGLTTPGIVGAEFVRARGGRVVTIPLVPGLSTTSILAAALDGKGAPGPVGGPAR